MIPVKQTLTGGPDGPPELAGDCHRACLCSLLELPIDALSNWVAHDDWQGRVNEELVGHGYWEVGIELDPRNEDHYRPCLEHWISPGFWIAQVASLNLTGTYEGTDRPLQHVVVMEGRQLVWDPAIRRTYQLGTPVDELELWGISWLVACDPKSRARPAAVVA